jgi:hypothetical protein
MSASDMVGGDVPAAVRVAAADVVRLDQVDGDGGGTAWPIAGDGRGTQYATCAHSVPEGKCGSVGGASGEVVASDVEHDCAAITVPGQHGSIPLAQEDAPAGTRGWIVGYPADHGYQRTITPVVVTGNDGEYQHAPMTFDGFAGPGASGGPVLNDHGEAIGIYDAYWEESNQGGALPASQIRQRLGVGYPAAPSPREPRQWERDFRELMDQPSAKPDAATRDLTAYEPLQRPDLDAGPTRGISK